MPDQVITTSIVSELGSAAFTLAGGDTLLLMDGVSVHSMFGTAISTASGAANALVINGSAIGYTTAVRSQNAQSTVIIGALGKVEGQYGLYLVGTHAVQNFGSVLASDTGILATAGNLSVLNTGRIETSAGLGNGYAIVGASGSDFVANDGFISGRIILGDGNDTYFGRSGTHIGLLSLGAGQDAAFGGSSSETFSGDQGNDVIDGGGGNDVATFSGNRSQYAVQDNLNGSFVVADSQAARDGTDTLRNIRFAQFADQKITLTNAAPVNLALSTTAFAENTPVTGIVASLAAFDADGDALSYSLTSNPSGLFKLDGANLVLAGALDFEALSHHSIAVTAKDTYGGEVTRTFDLSVTNVVETNPLTLRGTRGADRLTGEAGSDKFYGGLSNDIITGGAGRDIFVFDTRPNKRTNLDRIIDFNVRDDTVHLVKSFFSKISKKGVLAKSAFWQGDKAHDATDRVIYNKKTGALFYDQDGNGAKAAVQFATVSKNLKMTAHDFYVL